MQTVFDNAMVAHVWAQRSQADGRSHNGNFSFEGNTLYSYRTAIGRFVETRLGGYAVLVTSRRYSITTSSKHMPALYRALHEGGYQAFHVPNLYPGHEENRDHLLSAYRAEASRAQRARTYYGTEEDLAKNLRELADTVNRYEDLFELPQTSLNPEELARATMEARRERLAKANTPAAIAKREKAREQREARAARKLELAAAEAAERVEAWRKGEPVTLRYGEGTDGASGALLRVKGDTLETSLGAKVPLADAVRVFKFVKLCKARGQGSAPHPNMAWQRNGDRLPVGHFQVDWISTTGTFRAGCHLIHWDEIARAAEAAGVLFEEAADTTVKAQAA